MSKKLEQLDSMDLLKVLNSLKTQLSMFEWYLEMRTNGFVDEQLYRSLEGCIEKSINAPLIAD